MVRYDGALWCCTIPVDESRIVYTFTVHLLRLVDWEVFKVKGFLHLRFSNPH